MKIRIEIDINSHVTAALSAIKDAISKKEAAILTESLPDNTSFTMNDDQNKIKITFTKNPI